MRAQKRFIDFVPCRYVLSQDLQARLDQTLCRYNGEVVYVRVSVMSSTAYEIILYGWPDSSRKIKSIQADDPLFDISMFDLGYMNYIWDGKNRVLYPSRNTAKKYKQGTCISYLEWNGIGGEDRYDINGQPGQSIGFVDMVMGNYPIDMSSILNGTVSELALSPDLAVKTDELGVLEYYWRRTKIAIKVPGQPIHRLDTEFSWVIDKVLGAYL